MNIDIHHHHLGEGLWTDLQRIPGMVTGSSVRFPDGTLSRPVHSSLVDDTNLHERMNGWDTVVLSTWMDIADKVGFGNEPCSIPRLNDALLSLRASDRRIQILATLGNGSSEEWRREIDRCMEQGIAGLAVPASILSRAVEGYDDCWTEIERLRLPLMIHPTWSSDPQLASGFKDNLIGNPFQTTIAACNLLQSGFVDRFPELDIILAHGGGFLPYQIGRLQRWWTQGDRSSREPTAALTWFWYDTVLLWPPALRALSELVGCNRLLAGTDSPFPMSDSAPKQSLAQAGIEAERASSVLGGNAASLLVRREHASTRRTSMGQDELGDGEANGLALDPVGM